MSEQHKKQKPAIKKVAAEVWRSHTIPSSRASSLLVAWGRRKGPVGDVK